MYQLVGSLMRGLGAAAVMMFGVAGMSCGSRTSGTVTSRAVAAMRWIPMNDCGRMPTTVTTALFRRTVWPTIEPSPPKRR